MTDYEKKKDIEKHGINYYVDSSAYWTNYLIQIGRRNYWFYSFLEALEFGRMFKCRITNGTNHWGSWKEIC